MADDIISDTVDLETVRRENERERRSTYKRERRELRLSLLKTYQCAKETHGREPGFTAIRFDRQGKLITLPPFMNRVLKACKELLDNRYRFGDLYKYGGLGMNYKNARRVVAQVMAVMLARSEFVDGRLGVPTRVGMDTISYHEMMCDYVLRFGEHIEESTWYTAIRYLKRSGYIVDRAIQISFLSGDGFSSHRAAASYKQWTFAFFRDLKVTLYKNIAQEIVENRHFNEKKQLSFEWIAYTLIAGKLRQFHQPYNHSIEYQSALFNVVDQNLRH